MWKRLKRLFRSVFGGVISSMEDPVLILEQNIRDMRDKVPQMNESIALIKANVTLLEREIKKLDDEEKTTISNVKAAISQSRDDIAAGYAGTLEHIRASKGRALGQLEVGKKALGKSMDVKKAFMKEIETKTKEATLAIQEAKRAKWQKEVAGVMEEFEVGGIDQSHDEMVAKIEQDSAMSEAKLDLALDKVDGDKMKIEDEAEKIRASELVKQFKIEMGMDNSSVADVSSNTESNNQQQKVNS